MKKKFAKGDTIALYWIMRQTPQPFFRWMLRQMVWLLETNLDSLGDSAINDFMRDAKS